MTVLTKMDPAAFAGFAHDAIASYAQDNVLSGHSISRSHWADVVRPTFTGSCDGDKAGCSSQCTATALATGCVFENP